MSNTHIITIIFLSFLFVKTIVEYWLCIRNQRYIKKHRNNVPEKFTDKISIKDHQKAADYTTTKIKFGYITRFYGVIILLLWTIGGGFNFINSIASNFNYGVIITGIIFLSIFSIISTVLSLPESIISTFIIEEKFGFNKTTVKTFITDLIKSLMVGAIIMLPIFAALIYIVEKLGKHWWIYGWIFLTITQFVIMYLHPRFIAPLFNKFTPLEEGQTKDKILGLLKKTGFVSNGLFVMNASLRSSHGNAYFTGFGKNKRIVFFDTLIKLLDAEEVEAVLAHELGHFKKKHILKTMILSIVLSFLGFALMGYLFNWIPFFLGHGVNSMSTYTAFVLFASIVGIYMFPITPIATWYSRKNEFEADYFASQYASANKLITALVKLYKDNAATLTPDPIFSSFYNSHPPALTRVKNLETLEHV